MPIGKGQINRLAAVALYEVLITSITLLLDHQMVSYMRVSNAFLLLCDRVYNLRIWFSLLSFTD